MQIEKPKSAKEKEILSQLLMLDQEIRRRESVGHPGHYGMPDLLFPKGFKQGYYSADVNIDTVKELEGSDLDGGWVRAPLEKEETDEEYIQRQNRALRKFITENLFITKDGRKIYVHVIPQQLDFIADIFFKRVSKVILWKPRGGGGSLSAAVLIWILLVYRKVSVLDLAGCLLPGTLVWTKSGGWIPVEEVREGDEVYGRDGNIHRVLGKTCKMWNGQVTDVIPWGHAGSSFTSDHRISVLRNVVKRRWSNTRLDEQDLDSWDERETEWVDCGSLTEDDVFVIQRPKEATATIPTLSVCLNANGLGEKTEVPWTPALCRFVGYWLAEGDTYKIKGGKEIRFNLSMEDDWVDDLKNIISVLFNRKPYYSEQNPGKTRESQVVFGSIDVANFLNDVFGKYSYGKRIPWEFVVGLSDACLWNLLVGYIRGDGCSKKTSGGSKDVSCYTTSRELASACYWISIRLGLFPSLSVECPDPSHCGFKQTREGWVIRWGSKDADTLLTKAFSFTTQKDRQHRQRHVWFTDDRLYVGVKDIKQREYKGEVWDLEVEDDPSFSLPMMTVHNSGDQAKIVYDYVKEFWDTIPGLTAGLIDGEPLSQVTRLTTGIEVKCVPSTEKQARGKHYSVIVVDESCLLLGTLVWTSRGFVPVEEVEVGDEVLNKDGKLTKVKKVWSKDWSGEVVHVQPAGYRDGFTVTDDHRVFTAPMVRKYDGWGPEVPEEFEWKNAEELSDNHWLFVPKAAQGSVDADLPVPLTEEFCKWLGYWIGDGWTDKGRSRNVEVVFNKASPKLFIEEYSSLAQMLFDREPFSYTSDMEHHKNTETCHFTHQELADWLDENCGTTAVEKCVPISLFSCMSEDQLRAFFVGYVRADGGVWNGLSSTGGRCRRLSFCTSSERLCSGLIYGLSRLGIVASFRKKKGKWSVIRGRKYWSKESWVIDVNGEAMEELASMIMPEWERKRSYNKWKSLKGGMAVPIKKVEKSFYEGPVWDIEVEDGDSFLLPNGIVHNCQEDPRPERAMRAAIQGALSEYDPVIVLLSTFHVPHGMFQEYWDDCENKGFSRYKWSCLHPDTWVQTDGGYKRIKDVVFGDRVVAEDGKFHLVLDSWGSEPTKPMLKVRSVGWNSGFSCTSDHLVRVARIERKRRGFEVVERGLWVQAADLDVSKHVLQVPVPKFTAEDFCIDLGYRDSRTKGGWVDFSVPMTPDLAEFLGMWLGDGSLDDDKVCCDLGDGRYERRYTHLVKVLFGRKVYVDGDRKNQRGRFAHRGLVRYLRTCYVDCKKALPWDNFLRFRPSCLIGFLKGLGVSDGSVDKNFRFGQVSPILSQQFWMASTAVSLFPNVLRSKQTTSRIDGRFVTGEDWWAQQISGKTAASYGLVKPLRRNRRQLIVSDGDSMYVPLKSIEPDESPELVWDLAVEGVHSFNLIWGVVHNCFDTMLPCVEGLEQATDEDPNALEYCKTCFLTEKKMIKDISGQFEIETFTGCNGYARNTKGWMTFDQICEQKKLNIGTTIFECEFCCERPQYATSVYPPELIDASLTDPISIDPETDRIAVGIDWGIQTAGSLAIIMIVRKSEFIYVSEIIFSDHKLVSDVADLLNGWRESFGQFPVCADASHPFNNAELSEAGFDIRPVSFGSWKKIGIENVSKYFVFKRLKINRGLETLLEQLRKFRRNETSGSVIKKDDHGPDSLMVALLNFRFEEEFGPDIAQAAVLEQQSRLLEKKKKKVVQKDKVSFSDEGMVQASTVLPDFIPQEAIIKRERQKNILVF